MRFQGSGYEFNGVLSGERLSGFLVLGGKRFDFLLNLRRKKFDDGDDIGCLDNPPSSIICDGREP